MSKKGLAVSLSKLKVFTSPTIGLEQYPTDSEVAADALWTAYMHGDIEGKTILDLGAGTGILSFGALLLGAKRAIMVEIDEQALAIAKENKALIEEENGVKMDCEFISGDINSFFGKADVVIMNPPFGTKNENADREFLDKAFTVAKVIYSFHKAATKEFIEKYAANHDYKLTHYKNYSFPLKQTMKIHAKKIHRIDVGLFRLEKNS